MAMILFGKYTKAPIHPKQECVKIHIGDDENGMSKIANIIYPLSNGENDEPKRPADQHGYICTNNPIIEKTAL